MSSSLGCSGHEVLVFRIPKGVRKDSSRVQTLDFKQDFSLYRELVGGRNPLGGSSEGQGSSGKLASLQDSILQAIEQSIPVLRKTRRHVSRWPWLSRDLRAKMQCKNAAYGWWMQKQATKEEFTNVAQACRDGVRKVNVHVGLRLARKIESAKKSLYHYLGSRRLNKGPFLNAVGDLVTGNTDKTETLNASFTSVFTNKVSQASMLFERVQRATRQG